jgi:hypothetical protein
MAKTEREEDTRVPLSWFGAYQRVAEKDVPTPGSYAIVWFCDAGVVLACCLGSSVFFRPSLGGPASRVALVLSVVVD